LTANLRKVQQLSRPERWVLLQACLALPLVALGVRGFGLRPVHAILIKLSPLPPKLNEDSQEFLTGRALAVARLVQIAGQHGLGRPRCLVQSLTLWWFLRRRQINADLRIGVSPQGDRLEAHAWVEFHGLVLNDGDDVRQRFAPFHGNILGQKTWE